MQEKALKQLRKYLEQNHRKKEFEARLNNGDIDGLLREFPDLPKDVAASLRALLPSDGSNAEAGQHSDIPKGSGEPGEQSQTILGLEESFRLVSLLWVFEHTDSIRAALDAEGIKISFGDGEGHTRENVFRMVESIHLRVDQTAKELALINWHAKDYKIFNEVDFGTDLASLLRKIAVPARMSQTRINETLSFTPSAMPLQAAENLCDALIAIRESSARPELSYLRKARTLIVRDFFEKHLDDNDLSDTIHAEQLMILEELWSKVGDALSEWVNWTPSKKNLVKNLKRAKKMIDDEGEDEQG